MSIIFKCRMFTTVCDAGYKIAASAFLKKQQNQIRLRVSNTANIKMADELACKVISVI